MFRYLVWGGVAYAGISGALLFLREPGLFARHPGFLALSAAPVLLMLAALFPGISFRFRYAMFAGASLTAFGASAALLGIVPPMVLVVITFVVTAALFFGVRAGIIALAAFVLEIAVAAWAWNAGILPDRLWPIATTLSLLDFRSPLVWVRIAASALGYSIVIILALRLIFRDLNAALEASQRALAHLGEAQATRADAERAVQVERRRFAGIVNAASDGIITVDTTGKIVVFNAAAEQILRTAAVDAIGTTINRFIPSERRTPDAERPAGVVSGNPLSREKGTTSEVRAVRGDAEEFPMEASITRVVDGEETLETLTFRDITGRKRAEEERRELEAQLHESQRLEAIGTLAGGVAHDFSNLLAIILGNAELTLSELKASDSHREGLEEIRDASQRGKALVQQILAFGRQQRVTPGLADLRRLVNDGVKLLRAVIPPEVDVETRIASSPVMVTADATQMHQVVINLGTNAWQAIGQGAGRILVTVDELRVAADGTASQRLAAGRWAHLRISDTGIGIPSDAAPRIFEPFFTTKDYGKGTGLGLSVVHGIVTSHGGFISVSSEPRKGATFDIYLPQAPALPDPAGDGGAAAAGTEGLRVLLVDDETQVVGVMARALGRKGYRVTSFTREIDAVERFRAAPGDFDCAVIDFNMPTLTGLQMVRALDAIRPAFPVIVCSGDVPDALRQELRSAGVLEVLQKPFTADALNAAISRLMAPTAATSTTA